MAFYLWSQWPVQKADMLSAAMCCTSFSTFLGRYFIVQLLLQRHESRKMTHVRHVYCCVAALANGTSRCQYDCGRGQLHCIQLANHPPLGTRFLTTVCIAILYTRLP